MSRARRQRRYRARRAARTLPAFERTLRWALRCPGFQNPAYPGVTVEPAPGEKIDDGTKRDPDRCDDPTCPWCEGRDIGLLLDTSGDL